MDIAVIDYGMGNLRSVGKALEFAGAQVSFVSGPDRLNEFSCAMLPGVGAFGDGMKNLRDRGFEQPIKDFLASGRRMMGICLGMQMMLNSSLESPGAGGLGIFDAGALRFDDSLGKVPHIGWNTVKLLPDNPVTQGLPEELDFYFVHSFYAPLETPGCAGVCGYQKPFAAMLFGNGCFATQFHPEKSQKAGIALLKNFLKWAEESVK